MRHAAFFFLLAGFASAQKRPFTPEDLWAWHSLPEARITADGEWVAYVEGWNDRAADASRANLWLASSDGQKRRRITEGEWLDSSPRWSPDGARLAWISERGGHGQIYVRAREATTETRVVDLASKPLSLAWSPDGATLAFTARAPGSPVSAAWAPAAILPLIHPQPLGRIHVYTVPAAGGAIRQITLDDSDFSDPTWMPNGQWILAVRDGREICAWRASGGSMRVLTTDPGSYESPLPSPDGAKIAYVMRTPKPLDYVVRKIYVMSVDGARARPLTGALDRDAAFPHWSSDSRTVYFLADDRGGTHVYAARNDGTVRQATTAAERLYGLSMSDGGRAATVRSDGAHALDLVTFSVFAPENRGTVAAPNDAWLADRERGAVEQFQYDSGSSVIQASAVKPPGFDAGKRYPLLADVREGPREMCGVNFDLRAQIFAAAGFVTLCANTRGAPGYGEDFGNVLATRLPGDDFDDLMRGVDFLLTKWYIDARRILIAGSITAAWAIGHTDRLAAAVAIRPKAWIARPAWDDPGLFASRSPIFFARNFRTPTLVLAGDSDPESEAIYTALQSQKVKSALVRIRGARPSEKVLELEAMLAWLKN